MNPEDRFDECDPTDQPGIYEYYCEVFVDYNAFKNHEDELLEIQLAHPEIRVPFDGFWSEESQNKLFDNFHDPFNNKYANASLNHRVNLRNKGYIYIRDKFLDKYPQFADIFVGEVE